jgi:hypothetical protein
MTTSEEDNHYNEVASINFDYDYDDDDRDDDELSDGEENIIRELTTTSMKKKIKFVDAATAEQLLKEHDDDDDDDDTLSEGEEDIIDELTIASETTATLLSVIMKSSSSSSSSSSPSSLLAPNKNKKMVLELKQNDDDNELIPTRIETTTDPNKPPAPIFAPPHCAPPFIPGDHVYQWHKVAAGIIPLYHHHGIVMNTYWDDVENMWMLCISDFSNISLREKSASGGGGSMLSSNPFNNATAPGGWRTYISPATGWIKVIYKATLWEQIKNPSAGTSTGNECDSVEKVLSRVLFLQEHSITVLNMPYHWAYNNCETAAVWCKTGKWCTLQALCAVVTTTEITAVTTAPAVVSMLPLNVLVATQPYTIPIIAAFGVVCIGIPAVVMHQTKKKWNETTNMLNDTYNREVGVCSSSMNMMNEKKKKKKIIDYDNISVVPHHHNHHNIIIDRINDSFLRKKNNNNNINNNIADGIIVIDSCNSGSTTCASSDTSFE